MESPKDKSIKSLFGFDKYNRQQRRQLEKKLDSLTDKQKEELQQGLIASKLNETTRKANERAAANAILFGARFIVKKVYETYVVKIDDETASPAERTANIELLLSYLRTEYLKAIVDESKAATKEQGGAE